MANNKRKLDDPSTSTSSIDQNILVTRPLKGSLQYHAKSLLYEHLPKHAKGSNKCLYRCNICPSQPSLKSRRTVNRHIESEHDSLLPPGGSDYEERRKFSKILKTKIKTRGQTLETKPGGPYYQLIGSTGMQEVTENRVVKPNRPVMYLPYILPSHWHTPPSSGSTPSQILSLATSNELEGYPSSSSTSTQTGAGACSSNNAPLPFPNNQYNSLIAQPSTVEAPSGDFTFNADAVLPQLPHTTPGDIAGYITTLPQEVWSGVNGDTSMPVGPNLNGSENRFYSATPHSRNVRRRLYNEKYSTSNSNHHLYNDGDQPNHFQPYTGPSSLASFIPPLREYVTGAEAIPFAELPQGTPSDNPWVPVNNVAPPTDPSALPNLGQLAQSHPQSISSQAHSQDVHLPPQSSTLFVPNPKPFPTRELGQPSSEFTQQQIEQWFQPIDMSCFFTTPATPFLGS